MADRRVRLILEAQVDQFNQRMRTARESSDGLGRSLKEAVSSPEMQRLGRGLTAFGTLTVGALGMATKAASDWETSWTDVMRRTDGTPQQLNDLENALRGIATELPTTHTEVAEVAASAAQLGVAVDDVEGFTRVMIDMGNTTNMTAEQSATAMARFANVMGTPTDAMSNLGSAIVDLGNNSATTESEIMDMAQRIAGAGESFGMSEGEVLGFAAALTSVGIPAAAGGTAVSRMMYDIDSAVSEGGDALEGFADVAGMTASEFDNLWQDDSAAALEAFVVGLQEASEQGTSVQESLAELGVTEQRTIAAFTQMAAAGDLLGDSLERGNTAFEDNTAMADEAAYVYDTFAAQLQAFWSNIHDVAIEMGQVFLPALQSTVEWLGQAVTAFSELPGWVQASVGVVGALAGGVSLLAGGFILLAPGVAAASTALSTLGVTGPRVRGAIGGLGRVAQGAAISFLAMQVGIMAARLAMSDFEYSSVDAEKAIENGTVAALEFEGNIWGVGRGFDSMGEAIARTTDLNPAESMAEWGADAMGLENSLTHARGAVSTFDGVLADMVARGDLEGAADGFRQILQEANAAGVETQVAAEQFGQLESVLHDAGISMDEFLVAIGEGRYVMDEATGMYEESSLTLADLRDRMSESEEEAFAAALGVDELDDALGDMGGAAEEAALSLSELVTQLLDAGIINRDARGAARDYEQALDSLTDSIEENGYTLDTTTAAGRANEAALDSIADAGVRSAQAMADNGASQEELQESLTGTYSDLVDAAGQFGITGEEAHQLAAEILGVPDDVEVTSDMDETAQNIAEWLNQELDEVERPRLATILAESNTGIAESDLTEAARDRISDILADPDSVNAEGELNETARQRIADILADSETWDAEADFNETARDRIADIFADPDSWTAEGDLNETARERIADITADPHSYNADTDLNHTARDRDSMITASASTGGAERALNQAARNRTARVSANVVMNQSATGMTFATGGAVYGPGTGTSDDVPARLSHGEHVLTAREVALMGGQAGVYSFRSNLTGTTPQRPSGRDMVPAYSTGGAVQARQIAAAMSSAQGGGGINMGGMSFNGVTPEVMERGITRAVFRELQAQGVPVGSPS